MQQKTAKKLLEKVKQDYDEIAPAFSQTRQTPWPEFLQFSHFLKDNITLLDLGCGNGRLLNFLHDRKLDYIGVDISKNLLKCAKTQFPNNKFIHGDQLGIPLPSESVDQIWNIAAFHHIPSKKLQHEALEEMNRVLKKEGILILTVWNLFQKKYRKRLIEAIWKSVKTFGKYGAADLMIPWGDSGVHRYYHAFHLKELKKLLKEANFQIIDSFCSSGDKKVSFWRSHNICFICRKK